MVVIIVVVLIFLGNGASVAVIQDVLAYALPTKTNQELPENLRKE